MDDRPASTDTARRSDPHRRLETAKRAIAVASVAGFGGLAALVSASTHRLATSAAAAEPVAPTPAPQSRSDQDDSDGFFGGHHQPTLFGQGTGGSSGGSSSTGSGTGSSGGIGGLNGGPVMRSGGS